MGLPDSVQVPRDWTYLGTKQEAVPLSNTGLSPSVVMLSSTVLLVDNLITPRLAPQPRKPKLTVWAISISLAATTEIDISFFSTRYLDVSVPWVCLADL
jgi:hypothetical protein